MKIFKNLILTLTVIITLVLFSFTEAQVIRPKARGTPSQGPTIEEAQKEDAMGGKARVAVTRFENKSAKGGGEIGTGMAEMLAHALFATNRFIVLEREAVDDVLKEQDFGATGRVKQETAAPIGEIEGADLLIKGAITEFEPGSAGAGGGAGGVIPIPVPGRRISIGVGGIAGGVRASHIAMIIKVIDAKTSRILASEQVEGKATDIGGLTGGWAGPLAGVFGGYSKTPMEKAIRIAIEEAVRLIVSKTPAEYFRPEAKHRTKAVPTASSETKLQSSIQHSSQQTSPLKSQSNEPQVVYVNWSKVSLREGPGTQYKILGEISKGTCLAIIEERGPWIRVKLEDGREGWIGKATTTLNP